MKGKIWIILILAASLASCSKDQSQTTAPEEPQLPTVSVTLWSDRTELFMEYPELVRGENTAFAVHLTDLRTYRPLGEGTATIEFENSGKVARFESEAPSRPGIFRVDVHLDEPGSYHAILRVRAPKLDDGHDLGQFAVYESRSAAIAQFKPAPPKEAIRFLKEQQWASEFATEVATPRMIEETLQVPAVVQTRGGGEGSVTSPVRGRLSPSRQLPIPGNQVRKGDVIASVIPFTGTPQDLAGLKLDLSQAETDLAQARRARERLEGLLAEKAIPARRLDEAKADEAKAQARVQAGKDRLAQFEDSRLGEDGGDAGSGAFEVRAPLS